MVYISGSLPNLCATDPWVGGGGGRQNYCKMFVNPLWVQVLGHCKGKGEDLSQWYWSPMESQIDQQQFLVTSLSLPLQIPSERERERDASSQLLLCILSLHYFLSPSAWCRTSLELSPWAILGVVLSDAVTWIPALCWWVKLGATAGSEGNIADSHLCK